MQKTKFPRRALIAGSSLLLVTGLLVTGLPVAVALPVQAANESPPVEPIQQLINGLLQIMKAGPGTPFQQRFDILAPIIDRTFDLSAILEESVGGSWSTLPPDQQKTLADAFRRYTVASYVNSFDDYNGQHFTVSPDTRTVGAQQVVQTQVIPKNGNSHELDYVMRQTSAGWRVVDVLADGSISRVAVQRSDFRRLLARGGAQALAESLRTKSTDLFEGAS
jgi:phospholipid transport system substrate-binding protein